jgi:hypothetical protein
MLKQLREITKSSPKGVSLIEFALFLALFTAGITTFLVYASESNTIEAQVVEFEAAHSTPQASRPGPTRSGKDIVAHGPTDYQLELLRQANEKHGISQNAEVPQVSTASKLSPSKIIETPAEVRQAIKQEVATLAEPRTDVMVRSWAGIVSGDRVSLSVRTGDAYATIHWGDGSSDNVYANGSFSGTHVYDSMGPHQIRVKGENFQVISHTAEPAV